MYSGGLCVSLPVYLRPGGAVVPLALLEGRGPEPLQLLTQLLQLLMPHSKNKKKRHVMHMGKAFGPFITVCIHKGPVTPSPPYAVSLCLVVLYAADCDAGPVTPSPP